MDITQDTSRRTPTTPAATSSAVVIVGGAGKTGHRVAGRLADLGVRSRFASRSTTPAFDWDEPTTWRAALEGAQAAYVTYQPDLAVPQAAEQIRDLAALATDLGVERFVLLSGRGEEGAQAAERAAFAAHDHVTVCRVAWFAQNFTEGMLAGAVPKGVIALPGPGDVAEPFIDLDDVAEVAVVALTQDGHAGLIHELTGPEALTLVEAAVQLSDASGRSVEFRRIPASEFVAGAVAEGVDEQAAAFLAELFGDLLDGRNVHPTSGVRDVLGREPRSFAAFAKSAAAQGVWGGLR